MKSLKDISWQVSEEEYRRHPALSYSILARYEREGFNNLDKLFEKIESPSLTFGSVVDTIITGTEEDFNSRFMVANIDNTLSDTLVSITKRLYDNYRQLYKDLKDIPDNCIVNILNEIQWNNHWRIETRIKKIKEDCRAYYKLLFLSNGKTIISEATNNAAYNLVDKLKSADSTRFYFEQDNIFDNTLQRFYQLKFKTVIDGIEYKCMADLIVVNHKNKVVVPVDLKTSSKPEWDFYNSFLTWRYDIQARLYWNIIRKIMDEDPFYKDYKLADYRFIVANRITSTPLVWSFENTTNVNTITTIEGVKLRHPFVIGKELYGYLKDNPKVPLGISLTLPNKIDDWIL